MTMAGPGSTESWVVSSNNSIFDVLGGNGPEIISPITCLQMPRNVSLPPFPVDFSLNVPGRGFFTLKTPVPPPPASVHVAFYPPPN